MQVIGCFRRSVHSLTQLLLSLRKRMTAIKAMRMTRTSMRIVENLGIIKIFHTARTISNVIVMTDKGREAAERSRNSSTS